MGHLSDGKETELLLLQRTFDSLLKDALHLKLLRKFAVSLEVFDKVLNESFQ